MIKTVLIKTVPCIFIKASLVHYTIYSPTPIIPILVQIPSFLLSIWWTMRGTPGTKFSFAKIVSIDLGVAVVGNVVANYLPQLEAVDASAKYEIFTNNSFMHSLQTYQQCVKQLGPVPSLLCPVIPEKIETALDNVQYYKENILNSINATIDWGKVILMGMAAYLVWDQGEQKP